MSDNTKVTLLALPLMARSGVYRSTHDLVRAAQDAGLDWSAIIGIRPTASGAPLVTSGVREIDFTSHGRAAVTHIRKVIDEAPEVASADVVITLISQSDIAFARSPRRRGRTWVAWVRGKPWPAAGEQGFIRRNLLRWVETHALRQADEVWSTTPVLAAEFDSARKAEIIPAGIGNVDRISWGRDRDSPLVWAGRVDVDKRPGLFVDIVRKTRHAGRIFGDGPLSADLQVDCDANVDWAGWVDAENLWRDASIFVGTSSREAFGRSAVEAAAAGLPVVIGADYGAAPLLVTSAEMRSACIVDSDDPEVWSSAVRRILDDDELREAVSNHVHANAQKLTIASSVRSASDRAGMLVSGMRQS